MVNIFGIFMGILRCNICAEEYGSKEVSFYHEHVI